MSKYVESYWVELLPNGVYHLLINCTQREIYYHAFNDNQILICGTEQEFENWDETIVFKVEKFLPEINGIYTRTDMIEDEQISIYYIPHLREWRKNINVIIKPTKVNAETTDIT